MENVEWKWNDQNKYIEMTGHIERIENVRLLKECTKLMWKGTEGDQKWEG